MRNSYIPLYYYYYHPPQPKPSPLKPSPLARGSASTMSSPAAAASAASAAMRAGCSGPAAPPCSAGGQPADRGRLGPARARGDLARGGRVPIDTGEPVARQAQERRREASSEANESTNYVFHHLAYERVRQQRLVIEKVHPRAQKPLPTGDRIGGPGRGGTQRYANGCCSRRLGPTSMPPVRIAVCN